MGVLDRVANVDSVDDGEPEPDPRTVWSAIGTPMLDPAGSSDAAMSLTMRRAMVRVWSHRATVRQLIGAAVEEVQRRRGRDLAIMEAVGAPKRRTEPWVGLRPDAVVQLRAFLLDAGVLSASQLVQAADSGEEAAVGWAVEAVGAALLLSDAVPFFIPSTLATALMTSDPPDDTLTANIRLPFESVFVFFDAIPLGDLEFDGRINDVVGGTAVDTSTSALVGVVIHAGAGGAGLDPVVHWVLTYPMRDIHGVVLIAGVWRASAQPGVVANLAALCTWGDWTPPPAPPQQLTGAQGSRPWRRSLGRSAVRKAIGRGAVIGVHVVDVAALAAASTRAASTSTGRPVRTHWRRGYWNSVRVATRDAAGTIIGDRLGEQDVDWHYEGRWIHPVVVHGTASNVVTVYTVPEQSPAD